MEATPESGHYRGPTRHPVLTFVSRIPATLITVALMIVAGVVSTALFTPLPHAPLWRHLAYGLPAFEHGRWWTPITGALLVNHPAFYPIVIASFLGMAYLEYRRGWRVATAYFIVGQIVTVCVSAVIVWLLTFTGWHWALEQAQRVDVGPSGGTMICIASAIGLLSASWRMRAWLALLAFVFVSMVYWGNISDMEHLVSVLMVLAFERTLRMRRASIREQRFIAVAALLTLAAFELIVLVVPTDGLFGSTKPASGSFKDVAMDIIVIVLAARGLSRGRRWAWMLTLGLSLFNITGFFVILIGGNLIGWKQVAVDLSGDPAVSLANGVMWMLMFIYLLWVSRAFRTTGRSAVGPLIPPSVSEVKQLLHREGGGTMSWMATWDDLSYLRSGPCIVAYRRQGTVAIALGEPIGPRADHPAAILDFIEKSEQAGLIPCFFSAPESVRDMAPAEWRDLVVAADTIVDLPGIEFTGKKWNSVRTSINRAGREDVTFRMTRWRDEPWGIRQQLRAISEEWLEGKDLPEMGFTLGTLTEAADPEVRIALAVSAQGDVDGFLSWLPVYGPGGMIHGWTLDLMRRREDGFPSVMEFLIASSAKLFSEEGAQIMSLSGAPLAHDFPTNASLISALSDRLADALEPVYGFGSLQKFKKKFHPRHEPLYLLYRDEGDLTRVSMALLRSFLPTATLRQLAAAGFELVRR